jgi:hypothetical protein
MSKINKPLFAIVNHYRKEYNDEVFVKNRDGKNRRGRVEGRDLLHSCLSSLKDSAEFDYDTLILDNASETIVDTIPIALTHNYISLKDDRLGLTGAWNFCSQFGYLNENDFIIVCNDDIVFDKSINNLFNSIEDMDLENSLFGVRNIGNGQHKVSPNKIHDVTNKHPVYGGMHVWLFAFHRLYYEKYNNNGRFCHSDTPPWGGNERFQLDHIKRGAKLYINGFVSVNHGNLGGWRHRRELCKNG